MLRFFRIHYSSRTKISVTVDFAVDYLQSHHSFSKENLTSFANSKRNQYFHIYTKLNLSPDNNCIIVVMSTEVSPMKWYLVPLMPFIKTYMYRKQLSDLQYLKEQMEAG